MSTNPEPLPPQARSAIRLAIATHLLAQTSVVMEGISEPTSVETAINHAFFMADLLILKSGL